MSVVRSVFRRTDPSTAECVAFSGKQTHLHLADFIPSRVRACSVSLHSSDSAREAEQAAAAFYGAAQTELRSSVELSVVERNRTMPKLAVEYVPLHDAASF